MSDHALSLVSTGTSQHPRFLIADPQCKFWTGLEWSEEEGRLYASVNDAGQAVQDILRAGHEDKPLRRFVAPIYVEVYSETDLTLDQISDWLVKMSRLTVDAESHGLGPAEESLALTMVDWSELSDIEKANE